jgi:hypothetical protein
MRLEYATPTRAAIFWMAFLGGMSGSAVAVIVYGALIWAFKLIP